MKTWKTLHNNFVSEKWKMENGKWKMDVPLALCRLSFTLCLLLFAVVPLRVGKSDCGIKGPTHYSFGRTTPARKATAARTSAAVHERRTRRPLTVRIGRSVIGVVVAFMKSPCST